MTRRGDMAGKVRPGLAFLVLSALLCLAEPSAVLARPAGPRCDMCSRRIEGRYFTVNGHDICARCYGRYPKCPGCGMPVKSSPYRSGGERVCADCAARAGVCAHCGDVLLGRYYRAREGDGARFCQRCVDTKTKCTACGLPYRDMARFNGQWICRSCQERAPKCSACGAPIAGKYYRIPYQSGQFCQACHRDRPHCDFCGRPVVEDGRSLADGRLSCGVCARDSVRDIEEVLDILAEVARFLEVHHGMVVREDYDVVLVDNNEIAAAAGRTEEGRVHEMGLFSNRLTPWSPRPAILVMSDLPRRACMEVVAHEYAHMWQFANNPGLRDKDVVEGFAQWVAAQFLESRREFSALAKLRARSDKWYGTGYRAVRELEIEQGADAVMRYVLSYQNDSKVSDWPQKLYASPRRSEAAVPRALKDILTPRQMAQSPDFLLRAVAVSPLRIRLRRSADTRPALSGRASGD